MRDKYTYIKLAEEAKIQFINSLSVEQKNNFKALTKCLDEANKTFQNFLYEEGKKRGESFASNQ